MDRAEMVFRAVKILRMRSQQLIYVITHLLKPIELIDCRTPRVKPKVNYRLWAIMI